MGRSRMRGRRGQAVAKERLRDLSRHSRRRRFFVTVRVPHVGNHLGVPRLISKCPMIPLSIASSTCSYQTNCLCHAPTAVPTGGRSADARRTEANRAMLGVRQGVHGNGLAHGLRDRCRVECEGGAQPPMTKSATLAAPTKANSRAPVR